MTCSHTSTRGSVTDMARRYRVYVKARDGMIKSHSPFADSLEEAIEIVTRVTENGEQCWWVMNPQPIRLYKRRR